MRTLADLYERKLLFVTGKGGIGKSLLSACLAMDAARSGRQVLLVESSAEGQLSPLFATPCEGHHIVQVSPGVSTINLDMQLNFRDFVVSHLGFEQIFNKVFSQKMVQSFIRMIPGLAELTLLGRLYYESALRKKFDLVIFDAFATGHFLQLMTTPQAVFDSGVIGPVLTETKNIHQVLSDQSHTGVVMVTEAEPLIVGEAVELIEQLGKQTPVHVAAVLINRFVTNGLNLQNIQSTSAHMPVLKPILDQMSARLLIAEEQRERLTRKLRHQMRELGRSVMLQSVPDLGAVQEPLDSKTVTKLLSHEPLEINAGDRS